MDLETFRLYTSQMTFGELHAVAVETMQQLLEARLRLEENEKASTMLAKEYKAMETVLADCRKEIKDLKSMLSHSQDINVLRSNDMFGTSSEKMSSLGPKAECEDPLYEGAPCDEKTGIQNNTISFPCRTASDRKGRRSREDLFKSLPVFERYELDTGELDSRYGEDGWRICSWDSRSVVRHVRACNYVERIYTPVISYRDRGMAALAHMPCHDPSVIWEKSYATPSLVTYVIYAKHALHLPYDRQEREFSGQGFPLSKQVMCRWGMRAAVEFFRPVFVFLCGTVKNAAYQQADETTLRVVNDGRGAGSKSYIWVHCAGEFSEGPRAVVYLFELTRATEHLRKFYGGREAAGRFYLTCDAYGSYHTFEKEKEGICEPTGCFMHARRRWVDALSVLKTADGSALPENIEYKALEILAELYAAEAALSGLTSDERHRERATTSAPVVDRYFELIKSIDTSDPAVGERTKDAVNYSLNQESYLRRFLEDGHLCCDNGYAERLIKPVALGRRNWLFNNTIEGAECSCMTYSLIQTAAINKADPYYYLQYVIEEMSTYNKPFHIKGSPPDIQYPEEFLSTLVPWSEQYLAYEKAKKKELPCLPDKQAKPDIPKSPRKNCVQKAG